MRPDDEAPSFPKIGINIASRLHCHIGHHFFHRGTVLGHRYTEWIIPPGIPVYILATARAGGVIGASPTRSNPFFISHKSEKERIWSLEATLLWLRVAAASSFLLAIALLIWAGVSA